METIDVLEQKLHVARRGVSGARCQTGLVIDLNGPAGNIFYLMGVCNRLVRELGLSAQLKREYETEINSANDYQSRLTMLWADNTILEVFDLASIYLKYFFIDKLRGYNRLYSDFYLPNRYDMLKLREDSMHPDALKLAISKSIQFKICRMMAHLDHEVSMSYCYDKYLDFINYKDLLDLNYRMSNKEFVYEQNIKLPKIKTN